MSAPNWKMPLGRRIGGLKAGTPRLLSILRSDYTLPELPTTVNYLAELNGEWAMLGNGPDLSVGPDFEGAGDCESVRAFNDRRVVEHFYSAEPSVYPPDMKLVWDLYRTQNPGFDPLGSSDTNGPGSSHDGGMDTQTLLEYLHTHGIPGTKVKVAGWATVDMTNEHEVDAALALFGRIWLDVIVQDAQQTQFSEGKSWDWIDDSPQDGGHAIVSGGYTPLDDAEVEVESWMAVFGLTQKYVTKGVEQGLVVIWEDEVGQPAFQKGVDTAAAASAFSAMFGQQFPGAS